MRLHIQVKSPPPQPPSTLDPKKSEKNVHLLDGFCDAHYKLIAPRLPPKKACATECSACDCMMSRWGNKRQTTKCFVHHVDRRYANHDISRKHFVVIRFGCDPQFGIALCRACFCYPEFYFVAFGPVNAWIVATKSLHKVTPEMLTEIRDAISTIECIDLCSVQMCFFSQF